MKSPVLGKELQRIAVPIGWREFHPRSIGLDENELGRSAFFSQRPSRSLTISGYPFPSSRSVNVSF